MRHCVPILLPLRSPASRLAITSASDTPSALAASAGPERLRHAGRGAAGAPRGRRRLRRDAARLIHHLLRHRHADGHLGADAADAGAALLEALRHLVLHVVVQVADRRHARALVDRLLRLPAAPTRSRRRSSAISRPYLSLEHRIDQRQQRLAELAVARGDVEHRHLAAWRALR